MSIEELGAIGEFVASFGVIATLIYLAIQMNQHTRVVKLNTSRVVTEELQQMFSLLAADESLAKVFIDASRTSELNDIARVRYYTFTSNILRVVENAYLQYRENAIGEEHWEGITNMAIDYSKMEAFDVYWNNRKHWMSQEFQAFMEVKIIPVEAKSGVSVPGSYGPAFAQ
ncbi:MAG: hypothetical protein HOM44_14140 [Gammaproteobacteria bacterium]|nr:hypothetical protein [Gammaproteobacteria bacterium]